MTPQQGNPLIRGGSIYNDIGPLPHSSKDRKQTVQHAYTQRLIDYMKVALHTPKHGSLYTIATKNGLGSKLNAEQQKMLKELSRDTEIRRICFVTGKNLTFALLTLAVINLSAHLFSHDDLFQLIQPTETYIFIALALCVIPCILIDSLKSSKTDELVKQIAKIGFGHKR